MIRLNGNLMRKRLEKLLDETTKTENEKDKRKIKKTVKKNGQVS